MKLGILIKDTRPPQKNPNQQLLNTSLKMYTNNIFEVHFMPFIRSCSVWFLKISDMIQYVWFVTRETVICQGDFHFAFARTSIPIFFHVGDINPWIFFLNMDHRKSCQISIKTLNHAVPRYEDFPPPLKCLFSATKVKI